jgi:hypothetical protein
MIATQQSDNIGRSRNALGNQLGASHFNAGDTAIFHNRNITMPAARRNDAAHGNWNAYSAADVDDLIKGVNRFIAEQL